MAIASLVLGIISIVWSTFGMSIGWLGAIIGIVGIVTGAIGRKDEAHRGMATAGLVCSIIGTALCLLGYVACAACVGGMTSM